MCLLGASASQMRMRGNVLSREQTELQSEQRKIDYNISTDHVT